MPLPFRPPIAVRFLGALAVLCVGLAARSSAGESPACCAPPRDDDQLWLVSNRGLGCRFEAGLDELQVWRYDCERCWVRSDIDQLLAADGAELPTTVFVHGNRIPWDEAFTKGWSAYRALVPCADARPLRFII